jgi:hypothetical protein
MPGNTTGGTSQLLPPNADGSARWSARRTAAGADHDREVGGEERDERDPGLIGQEQQDRTGTIAIAGMGLANSVSRPNTSENADRPGMMPVIAYRRGQPGR